MSILRALVKADLKQTLLIEQSVHISPWTDETFNMCFESGYIGWVIEVDAKIIAFIVCSLRVEECHVLNLGVMHEHQRQGYGRQLLEYALSYARAQGVGIAYLEVRRSNTRAITLYQKMKFHEIGVRKDYYPTVSGYEDALIFAKSLLIER